MNSDARIGKEDQVPMPSRARGFSCDHLVVLAGPPCSGKSTLLKSWKGAPDDEASVFSDLGVERNALVISAWEVPSFEGAMLSQVVLHYDLDKQRTVVGFQHLAGLVEEATQTTIITIWPSPRTLRQRVRSRLASRGLDVLKGNRSWGDFRVEISKARRLLFQYRDLEGLRAWCQDWLRHCVVYAPNRHLLSRGTEETPPICLELSHTTQLGPIAQRIVGGEPLAPS